MPDDRFESALAELLQAEERGETLDLSRLLRTAPELETRLREFFRNRDGFDRLAPQLAPTATHHTGPPLPELPAGSRLGDYAVLHEVGRGGRGIVYRVRDPELNRPLAVKVLRPELHGEPDAVRRFLEEAQVMGQLQHPGIVPVHAVGRLPDGRPYFAMKLVQGRTLAALLAERPAPADDLPHLLGIFQQVCQAMAYAHSRGVIHRDLKPSNIMVGAFAEVQVMDWGLAKVLGTEAVSPEPAPGEPELASAGIADTIRTVRTEGTGLASADGLVVGTLPYMPPEQAQGLVEQLDPRTDVFGLGALLCEILTGLPPYAGAPAWKVHLMAAAGDLSDAFARLDHCGADAELIVLARSCLDPEREHRPPDAGAVAERLATYLTEVQERLRQAELDSAAAQARAEEARATARAERRARRLTAGLAVAVLAVVVTLTIGGLWLQRQQAEEARQAEALRRDVGTALAQAIRFRQSAHFKESRELLEQARQRLGTEGSADLRAQVDQALADTALAERLDDARQRALTLVEGGRKLDLAGTEQEYAAALKEAGLGHKGDDAEVMGARVRASAVRAEVIAALDDWAGITTDESLRTWLLAVARAADPDPDRDQLRQPKLWRDPAALARLAEKARVAELSPQLAAALGQALLSNRGDAIALLRKAQQHHLGDFWLSFNLGAALCGTKQWDDAISYYRAALALRPRAGIVYNNLGLAQQAKGQLDAAIRSYKHALQSHPQAAPIHCNLADALRDKGRLEEAVREYQAALRLDPGYSKAHNNLGNVLRKTGKLDEAIRHFTEAVRKDHQNAAAHTNLGTALFETDRLDEAVAYCEQAVTIDPKNAEILYNLGIVRHAQGRLDEAADHYRKAFQINPNYAEAHGALGRTLLELGCFAQAEEATRRCLNLLPQDSPVRARAEQQLKRCERILSLEGRLADIVEGKDRPARATEKLEFAWMCQATKHFAAAVRLYAEAFAADPRLAFDMQAAHRYHAACCAAQAALTASDEAQPRLRRQALEWLQADLAVWHDQAETGSAMGRALGQRVLWAWQQSPDLTSVRDQQALARLPDAERSAWMKLWTDVKALRKQLREIT
jgi:serine/threonine-protein kinase